MDYYGSMNQKETSWKQVGRWYDQLVSQEGHYYHENVIFPHLLDWVHFKESESILDLGCGQGILARKLPQKMVYYGLDAAKPLIAKAKSYSSHHFLVRDVTKPLQIEKKDFHYAALILSLQNMAHPKNALQQAANHLQKNGKLFLVLNHPCFRIPRQSSWGVDENQKSQYRRIDRYMTPMEIPIQMHPSQKSHSKKTYSYHFSLSDLTHWIRLAGFTITRLEEWCSEKTSTGKYAKMENRARTEFPLFLAIEANRMG